MSVPLQNIPRCGSMLLALILALSGCASHDNAASRGRPVQKYYRPAYVQPPVMPVQRVQAWYNDAPEDARRSKQQSNVSPEPCRCWIIHCPSRSGNRR